MKSTTIASSIAALAPVAHAAVSGFDISGYQPTVDFAGAYADGARFVMIKVRPRTNTLRLMTSQCQRTNTI